MSLWKTDSLLSLGITKTGTTPKTSVKENFGDAIPFIKPADFQPNGVINYGNHGLSDKGLSESRLIEKDSVLMVCIGATIGKVGYTSIDVAANQQINSFTPHDGLLAKYCYYAMLEDGFKRKVILSSGQATLPIINKTKWSNLEISYPVNIDEQKRIVAILDQAFADIDQARAKTEQNLKNARELFESYLQQVFSQRGEGWVEKKWGDLCKFVRGPFGGSLKKAMFKEEGFAVYEQKHAIHDHIEKLRYFVDDQKFEEMRRFEVKPGELIMSCSGVTLGRVSVIPEGAPQGIINQALLKLTPNEDIDIHFVKYWVRSKIFQDIIFEHSGGAAIPNVPAAKILKEIVLQIPSIDQQSATVLEIDTILSKTNEVVEIYKKKICDLDDLKKSILQKAFTGELTKQEEGVAA